MMFYSFTSGRMGLVAKNVNYVLGQVRLGWVKVGQGRVGMSFLKALIRFYIRRYQHLQWSRILGFLLLADCKIRAYSEAENAIIFLGEIPASACTQCFMGEKHSCYLGKMWTAILLKYKSQVDIAAERSADLHLEIHVVTPNLR